MSYTAETLLFNHFVNNNSHLHSLLPSTRCDLSKFCYLTFVCLRDLDTGFIHFDFLRIFSCTAGERRTTGPFELVPIGRFGSNLVCVCPSPSRPQKNWPGFDTRPLGGVGAWSKKTLGALSLVIS
jgi:hypothetical protein